MRPLLTLSFALVLALAPAALTACGSNSPAEEAADDLDQAASDLEDAAADVEEAAADAEEAAAEAEQAAADAEAAMATADALDGASAMSGEDFIAQGMALSGATVTVARCSLMTEPMADGQMACRVVDESGNDLKDDSDLPVDIFIQSADLDDDAMLWIAENCPDEFCMARITGDLTVSEGTDFREMTNVVLQTP